MQASTTLIKTATLSLIKWQMLMEVLQSKHMMVCKGLSCPVCWHTIVNPHHMSCRGCNDPMGLGALGHLKTTIVSHRSINI